MNRGSGLRLHHVVGYEFGVMPHVLDEGMVLVMKSIVLLGRSQGGQENHQFELHVDVKVCLGHVCSLMGR